MGRPSIVFRYNETVNNHHRVKTPLSNSHLPTVSADYIQFNQDSAECVPKDERVLPIPGTTPSIEKLFKKAREISKPPKRIRHDKRRTSCIKNMKKRRRKVNGFLGFKLYYSKIIPPIEPKVQSTLLAGVWENYEFQWIWEQYTAQYSRYPRSIGFVDWLITIPKYTELDQSRSPADDLILGVEQSPLDSSEQFSDEAIPGEAQNTVSDSQFEPLESFSPQNQLAGKLDMEPLDLSFLDGCVQFDSHTLGMSQDIIASGDCDSDGYSEPIFFINSVTEPELDTAWQAIEGASDINPDSIPNFDEMTFDIDFFESFDFSM